MRGSDDSEVNRLAPRYVQVAQALVHRIQSGAYVVGALLPTERALCAEFEISRHTAREALRRLTEAGYVQRRQGSGSQVVADSPHGGYIHSMGSLEGLFQYAADTRLRVDRIHEAVPDPERGALLRELVGQTCLIVEGLRLNASGDRPICWSTVFINSAFAEIAADLPDHSGAIFRLIEDRYKARVERVEQEIRAMPISAAAAKELGVSRKIWAVQVVRRYIDTAGNSMVISVNDHPGDRFSYSMELRRDARGRG